jgi:hypothetical protein
MGRDPLSIFSPPVGQWFVRAFREPTPTVIGSNVEPLLEELGFRVGRRRLILSA